MSDLAIQLEPPSDERDRDSDEDSELTGGVELL